MENKEVEQMTDDQQSDFNDEMAKMMENHPGLISYIRDVNKKLNPLGIKVLKMNLDYEIITKEDIEG